MSFQGHGTDPPQVEWSPSDTQLVLQAQTGKEAAFEMLYKRHFHRLYKFLTRLIGKEEVARELTQETFLKAWRSLSTLNDCSVFLGWLYRIAKNTAYDYQRHIHACLEDTYADNAQHIEGICVAGPEEQVEAKENMQLALARIPFDYRVCLILYHIEGYSKKQIADLMGIKENSVSTYISYGLRELRKLLREDLISEEVLPEESRSEYE